MNPIVGIIVLNWNGLQDTRACLESLLQSKGVTQRIYVVDNGSIDGSATAIAEEFGDRVVIVANDKNLLWAGGNNVGIKAALSEGCTHLLLLNNDTIVHESMVLRLVEASARWGDAILCPKIYFSDHPKILWYAGGVMRLDRALFVHRGYRQTDTGQYDTEQQTDWVTGCAMFTPRKICETLGPLDETLGFYNEDVDYCLRARTEGFPCVYVPQAAMRHKVSASVGGHLSKRKLSRKWTSLVRLLSKHITSPTARYGALFRFLFREAPGLLRSARG